MSTEQYPATVYPHTRLVTVNTPLVRVSFVNLYYFLPFKTCVLDPLPALQPYQSFRPSSIHQPVFCLYLYILWYIYISFSYDTTVSSRPNAIYFLTTQFFLLLPFAASHFPFLWTVDRETRQTQYM